MKAGCKYCRMEENGDIPDDRKDVFNYRLGRLFGQDICLTGMICRGKLCLITDQTNKEIKIRFCPMCGREL